MEMEDGRHFMLVLDKSRTWRLGMFLKKEYPSDLDSSARSVLQELGNSDYLEAQKACY